MENKSKMKITKNVVAMGIVSFFTDISSEMIYPIIPMFLSAVLKASATSIGLIEGFAEATASLLKVFSGYISDRIKRRKALIVPGYTISNVVKPLMGLSTRWWHVLIGRFLDRVGKGIRTSPRDALIAESTPEGSYGVAFGFHRTLDTLGAILGPLTAFLILRLNPNAFRTIFYITAIPGAIAVLVLVMFVRETKRQREVSRKQTPSLSFKNFPVEFYVLLFFTVIFAIGNSSDAFIILRIRNIGFSASSTVMLYLVFNISYAFLATPFGALSDKIGKKYVLGIGYLVFSLVYLSLALIQHSGLAVLILLVYGLYYAMTEGVGRAIVSEFVPSERLGTAFGLYHTLMGLSLLPASIIAGVLWDKIAPSAPFYYGAVTSLTAGIGILLFLRKKK